MRPEPAFMNFPAYGIIQNRIKSRVPSATQAVSPRLHAIALLSGLLLSLAFPGVGWGGLAWVAMAPYLALMMVPRRKRDYGTISLAFGFGLFGGLMVWLLAMHPLTWIGPQITVPLSLAIVTVAWLGVAGAMAVGVAFMGLCLGVAYRGESRRKGLGGLMAVLVPTLLWTAMEWVQAQGVFGFTWGNLATTQTAFLPLLQGIQLVGPFPLAGLIVAVNAGLAWIWHTRHPGPLAIALAVVTAWGGYGLWAMNRPLEGPTLKVAVVQGNVTQDEKWDRSQADPHLSMLDRYLGLTGTVADAKLVIWPESAIPMFLREDPRVWDRLAQEAKQRGQTLMTGGFHRDLGSDGEWKVYNAVSAWSPSAGNLGFDFKRHLVPYGEYVPGRKWMPDFMAGLNLLPYDLTPGETPRPFSVEGLRIGTSICFDSIFPDVIRKTAAVSDALVLVTNDAWYKRTAAPWQHLAQGALRAVENRRYFIQAANTGASGIVDPYGRVVKTAPLFEPTVVTGEIRAVPEQTPYNRFGDWLSILALAGSALLVGRALVGRVS
jgi:apolipoprotein N-acyltransferase